jgi:polyhydroxyalkanoate synthesis regulator phasin
MVIEALQSYAQLASGLTKTSREKALATAKALLSQAGLGEVAADAGDRVSKLADEIVATSKANRLLLTQFVDSEVTKAVGRLGLAKASEVDELREEVAALRVAATAAMAAASEPAEEPVVARRPAKKAAKKAAVTTTDASAEPLNRPAKKAPAKKTAAKKSAAKKAPAKKTAAKKAPAKSAVAGPDPADSDLTSSPSAAGAEVTSPDAAS